MRSFDSFCHLCGGRTEERHGLNVCEACGFSRRTLAVSQPPSYAPGLEEGIYVAAKRKIFSEALDFLGKPAPGSRLLDVGCAAGAFLRAAAKSGWNVEGIEIDTGLADKAAVSGAKIFRRPLEELKLPGEAYGAVTLFEVLSQMSRPADSVREVSRVLKPDGRLYVREFNSAFHMPLYAAERAGIFKLFSVSPSVIHNCNFSALSLRVMLQRAGFRDIRISNSRPTAGDPYRTGGRLGGVLTGGLKVLYYWLAQAVLVLSFGRLYAGSSLIATARK